MGEQGGCLQGPMSAGPVQGGAEWGRVADPGAEWGRVADVGEQGGCRQGPMSAVPVQGGAEWGRVADPLMCPGDLPASRVYLQALQSQKGGALGDPDNQQLGRKERRGGGGSGSEPVVGKKGNRSWLV